MGRTQGALETAAKELDKRLAVVPRPTRKPGDVKIPSRFSSEGRVECYQNLRANLQTRYPDRPIKTIVFCSTAHGDGATNTATRFAFNLAKDRELKVLLVDANLRTPYLHELFQIGHAPGLSDFIGGGSKQGPPIFKARGTSLYLLPCGTNHAGPIHLFETKRFDRFLQKVRDKFDYVILDAPPVPSFSEARVICPKVDGVVLVVNAGKTRRQVALRAKKELEEAGGKILGVVLNKRKLRVPAWIYRHL